MSSPWKMAVVADDDGGYEAVAVALAGIAILGRPIEVHRPADEAAALASLGGDDRVALPPWHLAELGVKVYLRREDREIGDLTLRDLFDAVVATALRTDSLLDRLRSLQFFDQLCHLPNRPLFVAMLDKALAEGRDWVVSIVDIDHFSSITNALGYRIGDALLRAVAARLEKGLLGLGARLARIGNDSFAVLLPAGKFDASVVLALFDEPVLVDDYPIHVSVTLGYAAAGNLKGGGEQVLKCASTALKTAKHQARGSYRAFAPMMAAEVEERVQLAYDLKSALAAGGSGHGGLDVHYQPQVDLTNGHVVGVEALVRWNHPSLGFILPDRFIFIAERAGLIVDLGDFVLERACRDQVDWIARGLPPLRVAVNVSMQQFRSPRFLPALRRIIAETGIDAAHLELEITESLLMGDVQAVVATLHACKALGLTVALDDFGTGYSSLAHLRMLPIDRLKVDRSFVRDVDAGNSGAQIAEMIVSLGHTLGKETIAEGIEQEEVIATLRSWGCNEGQGYWFARPMDGLSLAQWVLRREAEIGELVA